MRIGGISLFRLQFKISSFMTLGFVTNLRLIRFSQCRLFWLFLSRCPHLSVRSSSTIFITIKPCQLSQLTYRLPVNMSFQSLDIPFSHLGISTLSISLQKNFCSEVLNSHRAVSAWGHYCRKWQKTPNCHSLRIWFFQELMQVSLSPKNESWFI